MPSSSTASRFANSLYSLLQLNTYKLCLSCCWKQRGHQHSQEMMPTFFVLLLIGGLQYPTVCAAFGVEYIIGRYFYFKGYSTGVPDNRFRVWWTIFDFFTSASCCCCLINCSRCCLMKWDACFSGVKIVSWIVLGSLSVLAISTAIFGINLLCGVNWCVVLVLMIVP